MIFPIELNTGKKLDRLGFDAKEGQDVYYTYWHNYNFRSGSQRYLPAKFIRYVKGNKKVIIKRSDVSNPSRVPIQQVLKIVK